MLNSFLRRIAGLLRPASGGREKRQRFPRSVCLAALLAGSPPAYANQQSRRRLRPLPFILKNMLKALDGGRPSCSHFLKLLGFLMIGRHVRGCDNAWNCSDFARRAGQKTATAEASDARGVFDRRFCLELLFSAGGVAAGLVSGLNDPISFLTSRVATAARSPIAAIRRRRASSGPHWTKAQKICGRKPSRPPGRSRAPCRSRAVRCACAWDGYYFPIGPLSRDSDLGDHEAACSGLCPDAPTQLFIVPSGSDRIEDAVAGDARYVALPAAFRNRTTVDKTCACHRRPAKPSPLLNDFTLRKGDFVMTPSGIVVFRGAGHSPMRNRLCTLATVQCPGTDGRFWRLSSGSPLRSRSIQRGVSSPHIDRSHSPRHRPTDRRRRQP